jgi:hypothetical protein
MNGKTITAARNLFSDFIGNNQCYEGQISCTVKKFRRKLMIPLLNIIKDQEKKINENDS